MNNNPTNNRHSVMPEAVINKSLPEIKNADDTIGDADARSQKRESLLLVLPAPPLPLDQGYRHAAYNDVIQLSRLRDLFILICNGEIVYDFNADSYELNYKQLNSIPGVKDVTFIELNTDWEKPLMQRFFHQLSVFLKGGNLLQDSAANNLTQKIIRLCKTHDIKDVHLGITTNLFIDSFFNLKKRGNYRLSFTAHDIDADKVFIRMREKLAEKKFVKVFTNWLVYWVFLRKEIRACKMSRFVISMAYRDYERLAGKKVNVFFIPPYLHTASTNSFSTQLTQKPALLILGHMAFSAAGMGIEHFMEKVVPAVKKEVPEAVIKIIGKDASPSVISKCKQLNILYQKYVEDPEELWNGTTVLASPILVSKGIRIRILEAVSRGIPVVCTEQSATGFFQPEKFLRVTNDFNLFAEHCIELLTDAKKYRTQQKSMTEYFRQNLSEDIIRLKWKHVWSEEFPRLFASPSSTENIDPQKEYKKNVQETEGPAYETNLLSDK